MYKADNILDMTIDRQTIYVFASYGNRDVNSMFLDFAKKCGYGVLTCEQAVVQECQRKGVRAVRLPRDPFRFKRVLRKIKISFVVLAGDNYYGMRNYLARWYPSAFIQGISWKGMPFWKKRVNWPDNPFYLKLHRCLGLTATAFGKSKLIYESSIRETCRALASRIFWGTRNKTLMHGSFSDLVFLQGEWEREVWIRNGIPDKKIKTVGVIKADWIVENLLKNIFEAPDDGNSSDVLFFAQPLYRYSGEAHYLEELGLVVDECRKMGLRLLIKLHPRDDVSVYKQFESEHCRLVEHHKDWRDADNVALIQKTKVVMTKGSSSILVPLLLQKPVMYLDLFDSDIVHLKHFLTLRFLLTRIEDFRGMYSFAAAPENQPVVKEHQQEILSKLGRFDGQCWQRIKTEIEKFLEISQGVKA